MKTRPTNSMLIRRGLRRPGKLRVAMRRARGVGSKEIARECRLEPEEMGRWLGEDRFEELVEACRQTMDLPEEERLARLEEAALDLLECAVAEGDVRVALFLADQFARGKKPHRVLAEAVNRKVMQSHVPLDQPLSQPRAERASVDPLAARRAAAMAYNLRPWGGMVSEARRQLGEELVRTLPSRTEPQAQEPQASEKSQQARPERHTVSRSHPSPIAFSDFLARPATSSLALLTAHPRHHARDGP